MYAQLTTRCNMRCGHCMFSCTSAGDDMSDDVWDAALRIAWEAHGYITLGGGEPTLHPRFREYLDQALEVTNSLGERLYVQVITNGTDEGVCMELLDIYKKMLPDRRPCGNTRFAVAISVDEWHDRSMQSDEVLTAYAKEGLIHTLDGLAAAEGRGASLPERSRRGVAYAPELASIARLRVTPDGLLTRYCEPSRSKVLGDARRVFVARGFGTTSILDERGDELLRGCCGAMRWKPTISYEKEWRPRSSHTGVAS